MSRGKVSAGGLNGLFMVSGNERKFEEVSAVIPGLQRVDWDLPEIQETDPRAIIKAKLVEAVNLLDNEVVHQIGPSAGLIVEDTSLYFECMGGHLPGPLIKWFMKSVGLTGLCDLCRLYGEGNYRAETRSVIGYCDLASSRVRYFEASLPGTIVLPRGDKDFGWGPIFQPDGHGQTFGEMDREVKKLLSMRAEAARKLATWLESH